MPLPISDSYNLSAKHTFACSTDQNIFATLHVNVPTFAEAGLPGFGMKSWLGFLAPANTPRDIVNKVNADLGKVLAMPDVREKLLSQGQIPYYLSPEKFTLATRWPTS